MSIKGLASSIHAEGMYSYIYKTVTDKSYMPRDWEWKSTKLGFHGYRDNSFRSNDNATFGGSPFMQYTITKFLAKP